MFLCKFTRLAVDNLLRDGTHIASRHLPNRFFMQSAKGISVIEKWKTKFEEEKVPEPAASLGNILAHVLNRKKPIDLTKTTGNEKLLELNETQITKFETLCECRISRMPIQYIIGEWDFRELTLKMQPPVFIPRPETEELVELILQQCDVDCELDFLEIGCGSGAISLALLKSLPLARCVSVDQSQMACDLTEINAKKLHLDERMTIIKHKLTEENLLFDKVSQEYDLIVSNPPYVPTKGLFELEPEIKLYEDLRALDGGSDGLRVIKSVLLLASQKLKPAGVLWLEVDPSHPKLISVFLDSNKQLDLKFVASYKDMFEKERFVEILKL